MNKKTLILNAPETAVIRSSEEVGQTVTNVSTDIDDVSSTLEDIDSQLCG